MERSAGVIMHIASLPGKFGIGTFGTLDTLGVFGVSLSLAVDQSGWCD